MVTLTTGTAATSWGSHAAWVRLQSYRRQLTADLTPPQASAQIIAADRAAVAGAEAEVARVEAARAAQAAAATQVKQLPRGRALDVTV
ncbi:hypothetical protein [Actinoplanes teichomyceticus]|uniref:Uncharacterized protein n=1 Tax=Actinoplanes teichomyceticus TaxID=1867 RepID=A0A561WKL7_ACTTI|nr:hypothetical protein [Actinoplanes teichomyceticus]TWG24409.1 hypothetical protein FHX34_102965 [Actinoplanes teichomyceticus]GIF12740.1 hypothetical protein Ate01nite_27720 [Actinoplanes teichomyceticus]